MKAFSAPLIEAMAFFIAISFAMILHQAYLNSLKNSFDNALYNCKIPGKCYEGYIPYSKEELENKGIVVLGEGNYGVMYLNETSSFIIRLR